MNVSKKSTTNDIVVPVDAEVQSLALRTGRLRDLRTRRGRVGAGTVSGGSGIMVRTQAVRIRDGLQTNQTTVAINHSKHDGSPTVLNVAIRLTCGLVDVTLDVERSMTDTVPGDRVSGNGSGNGSGFIPVLAAAMHFTDRLIAAAVGKPG